MYETGKITNVYWDDLGSELVVDANAGSSTLFLDDAYDFNSLGGTVRLVSDTATVDLPFLSVDYDLDSITLGAPLAATWPAGSQVLVLPIGQQLKAMVDLDDQDEGIVAIIPSGMDTQIEDGIRDESDQEAVRVSDDSGRWEVANIDDERGTVQGTQIDLTGIDIPPYTPTAPPGTSPDITVTGNSAGLVIEATPVEAGTRIKYYVSDVDGFTPGPSNLYADTQATVVVVSNLPGETDLLQPDTPYYVVAQATNDVGDSLDYSDQVSATLNMDVVNESVLAKLVAGFILAGKIQVGQAYIDANEGIVIPQPDGGVISFPVNGNFAQITAKLIARSLNVTDNFTLNGSNNQVFGQITLGEGIVKPQIPPLLSSVHKTFHMFDVFGSNINQGLMEDPTDNTVWMVPFAFFGTGVKRVGKGGFFWLGDMTISGIPSAISGFQPFGGMVYAASASRYVMLGTASNPAGTGVSWYFVSFSRSGTTLNYSSRLEIASEANIPNQPRMAWDASANQGYLFYMNTNSDNRIRYITFQVASGSITRDPSQQFSTTDLGGKYNIGGAYIGNADFGAKRFCISLKGSAQTVWSGTPGSASRQTNDEWVRPFTVMDITWDGTRFWSLSDNGDIAKHSTNKAPAGRNTVPIQARHTWYDNNGTTHETDGGPIETHNLGARQWLRVETDPAPDTNGDPLDTEKADTIRVYISSDGTTTPRLQTADGWASMSTPTVLRKKVRVVTADTSSGSKNLYAGVTERFVQDDVGASVTGTNIPAGTTITAVDANGINATMSVAATGSAGAVAVTVTPIVSTRSALYEAINNANAAPPAINGFASVGRAPGAFKSTRTDTNGPLIVAKGDGSGRMGPFQWDNTGKTMVDFGAERPGTIILWPSASVPLDCIACQGQAVKRPTMAGGNGAGGNPFASNTAADVAPYIRIWQLFGTLFGVGDGSTTFNVPDLRNRLPIGIGSVYTIGQNEGAAESSRGLTHVHGMNHGHSDTFSLNKDTQAKPTGSGGGQVLMQATSLTGSVTNFSGNTGSGSSTGTNAISHLALNFVMKL